MTPEEIAAKAAADAAAQAAAEAKAAEEKAAAEKAAADAGKTDAERAAENEANKNRRLLEKLQKERDEIAAKLKAREDADLSEAERTKKEAEEAKAELAATKAENLRMKIAGELGVPADMMEFLTGSDEATLRAQAEKIASKLVVTAGTTTNPGRHQQPSVSEQIAAAQKSGNVRETIRLKREAAGLK